jgi:hypothetical protein
LGERPGLPLGSIVGVVEFCARAAPPCETWAVGLATFTFAAGCVRVAPAALAVVWREVVADDGPRGAEAAVCGPAFVGTSETLVTVLLWTACVERDATVAEPGLAAGASAALLGVVVRRGLFVAEGLVLFVATVVGRG